MTIFSDYILIGHIERILYRQIIFYKKRPLSAARFLTSQSSIENQCQAEALELIESFSCFRYAICL